MRITYSDTLISSDDLTLGRVGSGSSWNGQPILDVVAFFRAAQSNVYGRHDGPEEFTQRVWRTFDTQAQVLTFCATHRATLPLQADLTIVDDDETAALVMADAVREVRISRVIGLAVLVDYKWTGSGFASGDVPGDIPTDDSAVKTGYVSLSASDESKDIAFDIPFGATPKFADAVICPPPGNGGFEAWPVEGTLTASGFTAGFAAAVPGSGYVLRWIAAL